MKSQTWWIIGGIVSIIGGVFALLNPFPASLAVNFIAAWSFLITGILAIVGAFRLAHGGHKAMMILFGAACIALFLALVANPLAGLITLTLLVGSLILVSGIARVVTAFRIRGTDWFWPVLLSGSISVLLGIMIFADFPASALGILGIFLGVELIFSGISMFSMASLSRLVEKATED